jgi:hypothetical protein
LSLLNSKLLAKDHNIAIRVGGGVSSKEESSNARQLYTPSIHINFNAKIHQP